MLLLPIMIIPFIVGLVDDLIELSPSAKLIAQWITGTLIFFTLDVRLVSFYGLIGEGIVFPIAISYLATLATVILITNSLNLIDGVDGLAGVVSFIATLSFGTWFIFTESYPLAVVCFAMGGGILAFLFQNWEPSKIFMGDTGSLVIGTLLSITTIEFINENHSLDQNHNMRFHSSIGAALAVLIVPIVDTARIIVIRLFRGLPLFKGDKRHIHHALLRMTTSHKKVVYILGLVNVSFIGLAILMRRLPEGYLIGSIIVLAAVLSIALDRVLRNYFLRTANSPTESK